MKYILTQDDDGHWFVIPANMKDEWYLWKERFYNHNSNEDVPDWADAVGGSPSLVEFENYIIR